MAADGEKDELMPVADAEEPLDALVEHPGGSSRPLSGANVAAGDPGTVRGSNREQEKATAKPSAIKTVAKSLANMTTFALNTGMALLVAPVREQHSLTVTSMKTPRGCREFFTQMAAGNFDYLFKVFDVLADSPALVRMGLEKPVANASFLSEGAVVKVAEALLVFVQDLIGRELCFVLLYALCPPGLFAALLSHDEETRADALHLCEQFYDRQNEALQQINRSPGRQWLKRYLDGLLWPNGAWPQEVLRSLAECEFQGVPTDTKKQLAQVFSAGGTKDIEDLFNMLRKRAKHGQSASQKALCQWHLDTTTGVLEDAGKPQVEITDGDHITAASSKFSMGCFKANAARMSLDNEKLDKYLNGKDLKVPSAENYLLLGLRTAGFLQLAMDDLQKTWRCCLLRPGDMVVHVDDALDTRCFWVLKSDEYGALTWKCSVEFLDGVSWIKPVRKGEEEVEPFAIIHMLTLDDFLFMDVSAYSPQEFQAQMGDQDTGMLHMFFKQHGAALTSTLVHNGRRAFSGITTPQMIRIFEAAGFEWPGTRRPTLEMDVCYALLQQVFPDLDHDEIMRILARRNKQKAADFEVALTADILQELDEALFAPDKGGMQANLNNDNKNVAADEPAEAQPAAPGPEEGPPAPPPPTEPAPPAPRMPRPILGDQFTRATALSYCPGTRSECTISLHSGRAWQIKYKPRITVGPKSHMETWGGTSGLTHRRALLLCLAWAWERHAERTGEASPWSFE